MGGHVRRCFRRNLDCGDIWVASGAIAKRRTGTNEQVVVATLEGCAEAWRVCAEECERHASKHEHCRICAESCRRCERACREAIQSISAGAGSRTERLVEPA